MKKPPPDFSACLAKAENNVKDLDGHDGYKDRDLRTILAALEAGLINPETNAHFDAYVMLKEVVTKIYPPIHTN